MVSRMPRLLTPSSRVPSMQLFRSAFPPRRAMQAAILLLACVLALAGCQSHPSAKASDVTVATATAGETPAGIDVDPEDATDESAPVSRPAILDPAEPGACCLRTDLWARLRAGFRFDLSQDNERIAAQRNWYIRNQQYLDRVIARGARYMYFIVGEAEARDMPLELALLPVVESAFDPYAYSVADAAGPWQFIPSTGKIYGLKQTWWYDGRRDIPASTRAALDYLERLAARFDGDYYKALASYNAGAGTVSRAITRNIRAGKKTDYWSLKVPRETSAYVPKLIALAQIVQNPQKYGVRLNPVPDEPRFTEIKVGRQIDLARAAELADMPLTELYLYNPAHNRWLTDPQGAHTLVVPVELAAAFREVLAGTPAADYVLAVHHEVAAGETLEKIATQYHIPVDSIRMLNNLAGNSVSPGETLSIPQPRLMLAANDTTYEPRIVALNGSAARGTRASRSVQYTVRRGDTLSKIARKYKVGLRDLARWNRMSMTRPLRIGQRIAINSNATGNPSARKVSADSNAQKRAAHKVKPGETLSALARKFKVSVHDIARWNDFSPTRQLRAGENIKLYLD